MDENASGRRSVDEEHSLAGASPNSVSRALGTVPAAYTLGASASQVIRDLQRYEELHRSAMRLLGADAARVNQQLALATFPHYEAMRKLGSSGVAEQLRGAEILDQLTAPSRAAMAKLKAQQEEFDRFREAATLPFLELTRAVTHAYAEAARVRVPGIVDAVGSLGLLKETAAESAAVRALIHESPQIAIPEFHGLLGGLSDLTKTSTVLWEHIAQEPGELTAVSELFRQYPVTQVFRATQGTGLLITNNPQILDLQEPKGLLAAEAGELQDRLGRVDVRLVDRYLGALGAFARRERDYARQVSISLRELLKYLLEILAPTESIAAWDASVLPAQGKVTYKARLKFIFRARATRGYATMVEKDIDLILQNIRVLDETLHTLEPDIEHAHLHSLVERCEFGMLLVLSAHEASA